MKCLDRYLSIVSVLYLLLVFNKTSLARSDAAFGQGLYYLSFIQQFLNPLIGTKMTWQIIGRMVQTSGAQLFKQ